MNARSSRLLFLSLLPPVLAVLAALCTPGIGTTSFLIVLTVALLGVGLWPEYLTALIFFTLAMLLKVGTPESVFSGFCSSAFWLILGGFFLGQAVTRTGLGERLAGYVASRVPDGYEWALVGTAVMALAMSFVMPSATGRVLLMLPIIQQLAERLGYEKGSKPYTGIVLSGLLCTFVPAMSILPANIPNMVLIGAAEAVGMQRPDYAHYLLLHFPVLGILKAVLLLAVCGWMFRPSREQRAQAKIRRSAMDSSHKSHPWSGDEMRLTVVLLGCLGMWCTDSLHGISPAWVCMVGGIVCLLPKLGVLEQRQAVKDLNIGSLLYVAAIISIGSVVAVTGLGERVASVLLSVLPLSHNASFGDFTVLGLLATILGPLTTQPGIPAVLTPMAVHLSEATGFSPYAVMMTQVLGFSTLLFPFQTAPLMIGLHVLEFPVPKATKLLFVLAVLSVLILWPLDFLWWKLVGVL